MTKARRKLSGPLLWRREVLLVLVF
jgi:hypothetical protein